jgi:hypothetical protein
VVPDDKLPIFGDGFNDIDAKDREKLTEVYSFDDQDYILKAAARHMKPDDYLDLSEIDCIYGSKFSLMIKEAFRDDKHFILARLKSRG